MYHDTIHINFKHQNWKDINFDYSFYISKYEKDKFAPILYGKLLQKFDDIGFDLKYLKFNDIDTEATVYCTYNFQPNFNIFFSAYKKLIENKHFNITFEYGNIINGKFVANNMNYFAGVFFVDNTVDKTGLFMETVIKGKKHQKTMELYCIVDKDGRPIATQIANMEKDFEQNFFEQYEVKVALRKYKLDRLKNVFSD